MEISRKQISKNGEDGLTSLLEDSHASRSAAQEEGKERAMTATSGRKCFERYGRFSPLGSLVKTLAESSAWYNPAVRLSWGGQGSLFGEDNSIYERRQQYVVETICQDLEREGYSVQPVLVPACALGAPHRSDRVFFIAHLEDSVCHGCEGEPCGCKEVPEARRHRVSDTGDTERMGNEERAVANARCFRGDKMDYKVQSEQPKGKWADSHGRKRDIANSDDPGIESQRQGREDKIYGLESSADSCIQRLSAEFIKGCDGQEERYTSHGRPIESPHHDRSTPFSDRWRDFPTQPPVRCRYDGISYNVVRYINEDVYAEIKKHIRREDLSSVYDAIQKEKIRKQMGRLYEISEPNILLEVLQRTAENERHEQRPHGISQFSKETSERVLCYLRKHGTFAGSPLGQKYKEQFTKQFGDSLPELSHEIALATKKIAEECERTASWVRQESIKAYGNAIVPQVVYEIFKAIEKEF